ncbi:hypothetical protein BN2475_420107 [Paraburkholderia ribeironis]|uniref:Uncharacterized protein n=1 Tax=Paraburkholderia ribeironis TaxID=1247936 RepID=A0A1N7S7Y0_9BURK|nr:hypothetical protein BN2475_420107 [Paraburkholderia ribeironis]
MFWPKRQTRLREARRATLRENTHLRCANEVTPEGQCAQIKGNKAHGNDARLVEVR